MWKNIYIILKISKKLKEKNRKKRKKNLHVREEKV
jgi:hypothetical protein